MLRLHLAIGILIWVLFAMAWRPSPYEPRWIVVLLLFSPLVLMPLARSLWRRNQWQMGWQVFEIPAAALLAPAFTFNPGLVTGLAALPWLVLRCATARDAAREWRQNGKKSIAEICLQGAQIFPAIGAAWLVVDRLGWYPFGFDPLVVLLTAAHFHHAGFTLPLIAGLQGREKPGMAAKVAGVLVLAGVPLVAIGITFTHFQTWQWIEPWAVGVLVAGSLGVASLQLIRSWDAGLRRWQRLLMAISGLSLGVAMMLALGYGLRSQWPPMLVLQMPLMWAVHGTLNVFGFGLAGILSWRALIAAKSKT